MPYAYAATDDPCRLLFTAGACPLDADGDEAASGAGRLDLTTL